MAKEKKDKKKGGAEPDIMDRMVSLCKRRGFVFQSSEIYGGLKSCYDYGPLGAELKRNLKAEWWRTMVHKRPDVVGLDASIMMHPDVWRASGHLAGFTDPLVDCRDCKNRGRADHWPTAEKGSTVDFKVIVDHATGKKESKQGLVSELGIICSVCGSPNHSDVRRFNMMFRTNMGSIDLVETISARLKGKDLAGEDLKNIVSSAIEETAVYLRPETAQAMFVNFVNVQASSGLKPPFGIAQQGKSFRNEITVEHFTFRSCEFEQMEMEFFVPPPPHGDPEKDDMWWFKYWCDERLKWYSDIGINPDHLRLRPHEASELAHYAKACEDVEYKYPWGWGELEGIAHRTDFDLKAHEKASGKALTYFDHQSKTHYHPYVIEPAAGADRATLAVLLDAYTEEPPSETRKAGRTFLKLHPRLAPIKVAVLPLVKKDGMPERARAIVDTFFENGVNSSYDEKNAIGKRYARHDEIGTPYCITIDGQTSEDGSVTIRERDTMAQDRIQVEDALKVVKKRLEA